MYIDTVTINKDNKPIYDIIFGKSFDMLKDAAKKLDLSFRKACVVTDSNVARQHLGAVLDTLDKCCGKTCHFTFEAGERSKNLETIEKMYSFLIEKRFDRNDIVFALGGGVCGDMAGFLAATYLRGIRFVQVPTSLLAMVDSSIGGKTGVDFNGYKNMVGAFHMPSCVCVNPAALDTLPEREYISGFAEIIKHSIIRDGDFFDYLKENSAPALKRDYDAVSSIIYRSLLIKKDVVEEDPSEKGVRAILNFGHTLGHAIEKFYNFGMLHGECVALGSVCALRISMKRGLISQKEYEDAKDLFSAYKLPVTVSGISRKDIGDIIEITKNDKKSDNNAVKFILARNIGDVFIDRTVSDAEMADALSSIISPGGSDV